MLLWPTKQREGDMRIKDLWSNVLQHCEEFPSFMKNIVKGFIDGPDENHPLYLQLVEEEKRLGIRTE